jgi:hypothetical protein
MNNNIVQIAMLVYLFVCSLGITVLYPILPKVTNACSAERDLKFIKVRLKYPVG